MSQQLYVRDAEYGVTVPVLLDDDGAVAAVVKIDGEVTITTGNDDGLVTIDTIHNQVHEGNVYLATLLDDNVLAAGELDISIVVASGAVGNHLFLRASSGGDASAHLYEGVTTSGGFNMDLVNRDRASLNTPMGDVLIWDNATVSISGATLLKETLIPGGSFAALSTGGAIAEANGWILRHNTNYLYRVTNLTGAAEPVAVGLTIVHPGT